MMVYGGCMIDNIDGDGGYGLQWDESVMTGIN